MSATKSIPAFPALSHDHDETDNQFDLYGNLERFVRLAGKRLRYDHDRRRWLVHTSDGWRPDDGAAMRTAGDVAEFLGYEAVLSGDPKARAWAERSGMASAMTKLVRLARTDPRLAFGARYRL